MGYCIVTNLTDNRMCWSQKLKNDEMGVISSHLLHGWMLIPVATCVTRKTKNINQ